MGNSDIMMVLDTTGSMDYTLSGSQTRIQALRAAMKKLLHDDLHATANSNARVRYGFVPFSSTVNVGKLLTAISSNYIVDSYSYQSRAYEPTGSVTYGSWSKYSSKSYSSSSLRGRCSCGDGGWRCHVKKPEVPAQYAV
ncbi:hypothetical protein [Novosphingobium resinovorum]|uniref:hypothetical protein n=1 Tax=Novosphingobium resinovorum TaxID=158500 RepID=UPI003D29FF6C